MARRPDAGLALRHIRLRRFAERAWRIISTPRNILINAATGREREHLAALLARFHPYGHLKERLGSLGAATRDVAGLDVLLAPFASVGWPSRFSDGSYGVFYAARERATAIAETRHHRSRLLAQSNAPPAWLPLTAFTVAIRGELHDVRGLQALLPRVYARDDYTASQKFGRRLHDRGSNGIAYDSVRMTGGQCFAVFHPRVLGACRRAQELYYRWDGTAITEVLVRDPLAP
jgi:hypothetical protein